MRRVITCAAMLLASASAVAGAQQKGKISAGTQPAPAATRAHGGAMPASTARETPRAGESRGDGDRRRDHDRDRDRGDRRVTPSYILLGDGTILADVGSGYQQAIRSCRSAAQGGGTGTVITGGGTAVQPSNGNAPYAPPVYTPPTVTTQPASTLCWTTDVNGRIVIIQQP